jgi:DNA-binding transcriptional LysR family regulator
MPRSSRLSIELLETFLRVLDHEGDAMAAARELGINQPSMSKRLAFLQHAGRVLKKPWLVREGKTWKPTEEGDRVLTAVRDLHARYENLTRFLDRSRSGLPLFHFACGQQAAQTFVLRALLRFREEHSTEPLRITHLRGQARIQGVANGALDLATVTDDEETILREARRELHIDVFPEEHEQLLLAAVREQPGGGTASWYSAFRPLPRKGVRPEALLSFPLILPEPDGHVRRTFDKALRDAGVLDRVNVVLEMGGWQTILAYTRQGLGVGLLTQEALELGSDGLEIRRLDPEVFPPSPVRLICRKRSPAPDDLDLTPPAAQFRKLLLEEARVRGRR